MPLAHDPKEGWSAISTDPSWPPRTLLCETGVEHITIKTLLAGLAHIACELDDLAMHDEAEVVRVAVDTIYGLKAEDRWLRCAGFKPRV